MQVASVDLGADPVLTHPVLKTAGEQQLTKFAFCPTISFCSASNRGCRYSIAFMLKAESLTKVPPAAAATSKTSLQYSLPCCRGAAHNSLGVCFGAVVHRASG